MIGRVLVMSKSDFCSVVAPDVRQGSRIARVRRGMPGRFVSDYDDGTLPLKALDAQPVGWSIEEWVDEMNQRFGVSKDEANLMLRDSLLGWHMPIAEGRDDAPRLSNRFDLARGIGTPEWARSGISASSPILGSTYR